jgi:hypothetical protein
MLAVQEDPVDSADVHSAAALLAQVPVLAQPMAVLVVALGAEEAAEALVELLSRQSFSAAMARSTT